MTNEIEDIDLEDVGETHFVPEYANDIFVYLRSKEKEDQAPADYLSRTQYCTEDMRSILISWLMNVQVWIIIFFFIFFFFFIFSFLYLFYFIFIYFPSLSSPPPPQVEFKLLTDTLFLAVSLVDRFLAKVTNVPKRKLQLIGVTAIFLACKYEETMMPTLDYFVSVAADEYTAEEILDMENEMLKVLEWNMSVTTAVYFLRRCSKGLLIDKSEREECKGALYLFIYLSLSYLSFPYSCSL